MGILTSLGGAANRWSEAEGTPTKPQAGAGEGQSGTGGPETGCTPRPEGPRKRCGTDEGEPPGAGCHER